MWPAKSIFKCDFSTLQRLLPSTQGPEGQVLTSRRFPLSTSTRLDSTGQGRYLSRNSFLFHLTVLNTTISTCHFSLALVIIPFPCFSLLRLLSKFSSACRILLRLSIASLLPYPLRPAESLPRPTSNVSSPAHVQGTSRSIMPLYIAL